MLGKQHYQRELQWKKLHYSINRQLLPVVQKQLKSFISGLVKVKAEQDKARLDIARTNLERNYDLLDTADRIADLKIKEIDTAQRR